MSRPISASTDPRPVVIFGNLRSASLAHFCLKHDSPFRVVGFTVDHAYITGLTYDGLPLVPFEVLEDHYPPSEYRLLIPMGYQQINGIRRARYEAAKQRGYDFISYVSSRASIWSDLVIGENVLIYEHAIIQPFARIGDNCIIRSGAHVSHHCTVESHAFVAAEVAMGGEGTIGEQAFVGVGAVLCDNIRIGARGFIGAGTVVTRSTDADAVYVGNPARKLDKTPLQVSGG